MRKCLQSRLQIIYLTQRIVTPMHIDLHKSPEADIFRNKKKYILWFNLFLSFAAVALAIGFYAITSTHQQIAHLDNWALGILVFSAMGVTRYGNRLQQYKTLFPPQVEKLNTLRGRVSNA